MPRAQATKVIEEQDPGDLARTREALIEAMAAAISAVTGRDARGFYEHCGYRSSCQLL